MRFGNEILTATEADDTEHEHGQVDGAADPTSTGVSEFRTNSIKWGDASFGTVSGTVTWSAATTNFAGQLTTFDSPVWSGPLGPDSFQAADLTGCRGLCCSN